MMLLFQIVVVIVVILAWIFVGTRDLCPSCGTELPNESFLQGDLSRKARSCRCGWSAPN